VNSRISLPPDAEIPEVARRLINTSTIMVTVLWHPNGLYVNKFLESGTSFNSAYLIENVLGDIEHLAALQTAIGQTKRFVLHVDNSFIHKSRAVTGKDASLRLALIPDPKYSPDLA
jgi:hypothetical protein